jgi:hypothetical protein
MQRGIRSFRLHLLVKAILLWELEAEFLVVKDLREFKVFRVHKVHKGMRDRLGRRAPLDPRAFKDLQDPLGPLVLMVPREL